MHDTLKRGDTATTVSTFAAEPEQVTIVRAEYLEHPAFQGQPARRERWLHVRFANGGRVLMHPSNLKAVA